MQNVVFVKPLLDFKLRLTYDDGVEGVADLSHLAGRGVFSLWNKPGEFEKVYIGESGQIAWSDEIDLCPDALYLRITGKKPEDIFPNLRANKPELVNA